MKVKRRESERDFRLTHGESKRVAFDRLGITKARGFKRRNLGSDAMNGRA